MELGILSPTSSASASTTDCAELAAEGPSTVLSSGTSHTRLPARPRTSAPSGTQPNGSYGVRRIQRQLHLMDGRLAETGLSLDTTTRRKAHAIAVALEPPLRTVVNQVYTGARVGDAGHPLMVARSCQ